MSSTSSRLRVRDLQADKDIIPDKSARDQIYKKHIEGDKIEQVDIPRDAQEFYADFGYLRHPFRKQKNGLPAFVESLTPYQFDFWNHKGNIIFLKSNKIGLSTTSHLELFQSRLLPEEAGFDALLVAQNQKIANMHLLDLKRLVINSKKYSRFLITRPDIELFKEEKSKLEQMYVRNPYNPQRPSRIIAIGGSVPTSFSWKHINRIHMSDVSQLKKVDEQEFYAALYSRLANTNGIMKIETIPGNPNGEWHNIWKRANKISEPVNEEIDMVEDKLDLRSTFRPMTATILDAEKYGVVSRSFIDRAKRDLGELEFNRLFMCMIPTDANQWYKEEWEVVGDYGVPYLE